MQQIHVSSQHELATSPVIGQAVAAISPDQNPALDYDSLPLHLRFPLRTNPDLAAISYTAILSASPEPNVPNEVIVVDHSKKLIRTKQLAQLAATELRLLEPEAEDDLLPARSEYMPELVCAENNVPLCVVQVGHSALYGYSVDAPRPATLYYPTIISPLSALMRLHMAVDPEGNYKYPYDD